MSIPRNADFHIRDVVQRGMKFLGRIDDVIAKDDPRNITKRFTLYKVVALLQDPCMPFVLPEAIPAGGQMGGLGIEFEIPYKKGQTVIIDSLEGDPRRIFIDRAYIDMDHEGDNQTKVAQDTSDHPRARVLINGVQLTINKSGDIELVIPDEKSISWKDATGRLFFKVNWNGTESRYNIKLGDEVGIQRLLNEAAAAVFNNHDHDVLIVSGSSAGTYTTTSPGSSMGNSEMTVLTKAK